MYSYGLMLWRVLLDGTSPDRFLSRSSETKEPQILHQSDEGPNHPSTEESARLFDELKFTLDSHQDWAMGSIHHLLSSRNDKMLEDLASSLIGLTIKRSPDSRATDFRDILDVFNSYTKNERVPQLTRPIHNRNSGKTLGSQTVHPIHKTEIFSDVVER
jgi:hypothetical protein